MPSESKASLAEGIVSLFFYLILLGPVCFAGVGVWLLWGSYIGPGMRSDAAQDWVKTPCLIDEIKIHMSRGHKQSVATSYEVRVTYRYERDKQVYQSSRFDFYEDSFKGFQEEDEKYVAEHPAGTRTVCYVDADDPQSAVLLRQRTVGPGLAIMAAIYFIASIVLGRAMYSRPRWPVDSWPKNKNKFERTAAWRAKKEEERQQREEREQVEKGSRLQDRSRWPKRRKRKHRDKD